MTGSNKQNNNRNSNSEQASTSRGGGGRNPNDETSRNRGEEEEEEYISGASHITRAELLRRRYRMCRGYSRLMRRTLWVLAEELRVQYRNYYWKYGLSPFKHHAAATTTANPNNDILLQTAVDDNNDKSPTCLCTTCNLKPMALTTYCHLHILSDTNQKLYKPCAFLLKSSAAGPITCGKPILRSTTPSICSNHLHKFHKNITQALRKAGLNAPQSTKLAPLFHVVLAEYVGQIQAARRNAAKQRTNHPPQTQ